MTKSDVPEDAKHSPAWGTWEELLLAFAVNRYGTKSWSSISSELRKRTSAPIHITPHLCEQKYGELKRRFNKYDFVMDDGTTTGAGAAIPFLEDLRKLRVLELQKELQNYDLYISSLQSKVKKLTEESEKTGGETNQESDLGHRREEIESEKAVNPSPELTDSGQSVNGSNGNLETCTEKSKNGNEASLVDIGDENPESAAVRPEGNEPVSCEPDGEGSESPESIAESKSEGKNSDVQSSVGKFRKEGNDKVPRGSRNEDGREIDDTDSIPVRSLPLVDFLQKVQNVGSVVFQRRLDRQEKQRYKNLVRQHIDYETLQTRLKEGCYSDGNDKFFRDLLLLVTNTRIFFPKESPESAASFDLRDLILKEMISKKKQKSKPTKLPPKTPADSSLLKPDITSQIVVCRKRSSITAKEQAKETLKKSRDSSPLITKLKGKSPESLESKPEKKKKLSEAEEKKENTAKFLNRMKPSNDTLNVLKSSGGRRVKEQGSPGKRSVGRPPNRAAAPPSLVAVSGKRNRDSETLGSKQTKKRSKR